MNQGFVERRWGPREGKLGSGAEAQKGIGHGAGGEGCGRAVGVGVEMNPPGAPRSPLVLKSSAREGERVAARAAAQPERPLGTQHCGAGTEPQEPSLASFRTSPYEGPGVSLVYTGEPEVPGSPRVRDLEEPPTSSENHEAKPAGQVPQVKARALIRSELVLYLPRGRGTLLCLSARARALLLCHCPPLKSSGLHLPHCSFPLRPH